jgi:hypothetical protein
MSIFRPTRPSRKPRYARPALQTLETRETPATLVSPTTVTYQDTDGDDVTVRFSKPVLTAANVNTVFQFNQGTVIGSNGVEQQLWEIDLAGLGGAAKGTAVSVLAARSPIHGGNGMANVGHIDATGIDLGAVVVDGDLGQINAGDVTTTTRGVASLTVQSMGRFGANTQAPGGDLASSIKGAIDRIAVKSDFNGARIDTSGGLDGRVGTIAIGGSIIGGALPSSGLFNVTGDIGSVTVKGNIIGGTSANSGVIYCEGKLGSLTVGGSVIGGTGDQAGTILSQNGFGTVKIAGDLIGNGWVSGTVYAFGAGKTIGSVTIGGSVIGGTKEFSGTIYSNGSIGPVTVRGDLRGGFGSNSGLIDTVNGNLGPIVIGRSVIGGSGQDSAQIRSPHKIASVLIGGSLQGGLGIKSGRLESGGDMGSVTVRGSILGGDDHDLPGHSDGSGAIFSGGKIQSVTVGGSVVGGGGYSSLGSAAAASGHISSTGDAGPIRIGGDLLGGQSTGPLSGSVQIGGKLAGITIGGSVRAGYGDYTGSITADNMGLVNIRGNLQGGGIGLRSATIGSAGSIAGITIGGSISTGGNSGSGRVLAARNIGPILVKGSLTGTAAAPIIITAGANSIPVGTSNVVIKSLTVNGSVEYANILAGYDTGGMGVNADAQIGAVVVGGDWIASNLIAGSDPGGDGKFGTFDDSLINFGQQNPAITASIASIVVKGQVLGSPQAGDAFGFVAQRVGSMSVGGSLVKLAPGASKDNVALGPNFDLRLNEV